MDINVLPFAPKPKETKRAKLTDTVLARIKVGARVYDDKIGGMYGLGLQDGVSLVLSGDLPRRAQVLGKTKTLVRVIRTWKPDGSGITIADARAKAREFSGLIRQGIDPRPTNYRKRAPKAALVAPPKPDVPANSTLQFYHD